ncbi:MAG: hypothetical protein ACKVWV_17525 [Planctomycetota bacterium]
MNILLVLPLTFVPFFTPAQKAPAAPAAETKSLEFPAAKAKFEGLFEKQDRAGCSALWKSHPHFVLRVIDADLEGSLMLRESSEKPDEKRIAQLHERALWGARIAREATGHPMIADYASSFVGWNEQQRRQFRDGQAVYQRAAGALSVDNVKDALEAGRETVERALPLGDWWGTAMGYAAMGEASRKGSEFEDALNHFSHARMIHRDLGLAGDEYGNLRAMIELCNTLERWQRGLEAITDAQALAQQLGDTEGGKELAERRKVFESRSAR